MPIRMICIDNSLKNGPGYLLAGGSYRIGRSSRCSFIVSDLSVSRFHAELTAKDEVVHVKDMGSRNGTFVDGIRVEEAEVLPGQSVRFGNSKFQVLGNQHPAEPDSAELSELSTNILLNSPTVKPPGFYLLSKAQLRVLDPLLSGLQEKEAAAKLNLSPNTVHNHVREIYRKLNVSSRPELLALFIPPE
jgi:pSer/pThr/pTyr-binding forkhead associated (FHA) protein